jgi:hypothetical protein
LSSAFLIVFFFFHHRFGFCFSFPLSLQSMSFFYSVNTERLAQNLLAWRYRPIGDNQKNSAFFANSTISATSQGSFVKGLMMLSASTAQKEQHKLYTTIVKVLPFL